MATAPAINPPGIPNDLRAGGPPSSHDDLRDVDWAWQVYCREWGEPEVDPLAVRALEISRIRGRAARATYEAEWPEDVYIPNERFTLLHEEDGGVRVFRFPDDPDLPGLASAADPEAALALVKKHVMAMPPRRLLVEAIRYRPGSHAVLRHRLGKARFYARVMKPAAMTALLDAAELVARSKFLDPQVRRLLARGGGGLDV